MCCKSDISLFYVYNRKANFGPYNSQKVGQIDESISSQEPMPKCVLNCGMIWDLYL